MTSAMWIDQLVAICRGIPLLAALSFDGRLEWEPPEADDAAILSHLLKHWEADRGFGQALGTGAAGRVPGRATGCQRAQSHPREE